MSRTGVLFVHGIGEQRESESVRWFAGALVRWLEAWHEARRDGREDFRVEVVSAHLSYGGGLRGPARVEIGIPPYADGERAWPERRWVIAEGWWAARISPPDLGGMTRWALRSASRALHRLWVEAADRVRLIAARLGRPSAARPVARSDPGLLGALVELLSTVLLALLYLAALPLVYVVVAILFIVSLVPVQRWRSFTLTRLIEPFLVQGLGDFATYLEDDVQALHIRRGIEDNLRWLADEGGCDEIVLVAHSHGTVVAFDALANGDAPHRDRVRKLITVGAALNNSWSLYPDEPRMRATLPSHVYWLDVWSYYDPVPGGQLRRAIAGAPLVAPAPELRAEMRWYEEYVNPGAVPDGSRAMPTTAVPRQVTNEMNVLTDHDGYWRNPEQFLSRLAAEIDVPSAYYQRSRFHFGDLWRRTRRRRLRVTTLVGWRLAAMAAFAGAVVARVARSGVEQLVRDGRGVAGWVRELPGADLLAIPAQLVDGLRRIFEAGAANASALPPLQAALGGAAAWLGAPWWADVWHALLGVLLLAALFAALHLALRWTLYRPWDEREARESVMPELPPHHPRVALRTVAVLAALLALGLVIANPG